MLLHNRFLSTKEKTDLKSVNLQYNTMVRWDAGTKDSSTKRLMFQALFFSLFFIDLWHSKPYIFIIKK